MVMGPGEGNGLRHPCWAGARDRPFPLHDCGSEVIARGAGEDGLRLSGLVRELSEGVHRGWGRAPGKHIISQATLQPVEFQHSQISTHWGDPGTGRGGAVTAGSLTQMCACLWCGRACACCEA